MYISELFWILHVCDMKPINEVKIKEKSHKIVITSQSKRVDIWQKNTEYNVCIEYIKIYDNLNNLSSYKQRTLNDFIKETESNFIKQYSSNKHLLYAYLLLNRE